MHDSLWFEKSPYYFLQPHLPYKGKMPHGILQGFCHWGTDLGRQLQEVWRDGSFAEFAMIPAENVIPVRGEFMKTLPLEQLVKINYLGISYGALKAGEIKAGDVVVIAGYRTSPRLLGNL